MKWALRASRALAVPLLFFPQKNALAVSRYWIAVLRSSVQPRPWRCETSFGAEAAIHRFSGTAVWMSSWIFLLTGRAGRRWCTRPAAQMACACAACLAFPAPHDVNKTAQFWSEDGGNACRASKRPFDK
jgi:hypothetical protein